MHWKSCNWILAIFLFWHCVWSISSSANPLDQGANCGVRSVINLARYLGHELTEQQRGELVKRYPTEQVSMLDVKRAAESVGLKLSGWQMTSSELQVKRTPAIVSLPNHFALVDSVGSQWVRVFESEYSSLMPRAEFDRIFQSKVLLPEDSRNKGLLVIAEPVRDLGKLPINSPPQKVVVQLGNAGTKPISIQSVQPSCSCTVISQAPKVIKDGETVSLELNVSVPTSGFISADVAISSDAAYPVQWINIRGEVENDVLFDPIRLYTGNVERGSETWRTVEIIDKDGKLARPLKVEPSSPSVTVKGIVPTDTGYKIAVEIKPQTIGAIDEAIFIRNARGDGKDVKIPITGTVAGPLRAKPETVFFGAVVGTVGANREVRLARTDGKAFEITKIECPAGITADFAAAPEGKTAWRVTLHIAAGTAPATLQGDVVVRTTEGNVTLNVPIFAVVQ